MSIFQNEEIVHHLFGVMEHYTQLLALSRVNRTCNRIFSQPSKETSLVYLREEKRGNLIRAWYLRGTYILHGKYERVDDGRPVVYRSYFMGTLHGEYGNFSRKERPEITFFSKGKKIRSQRWDIYGSQNTKHCYTETYYRKWWMQVQRKCYIPKPLAGGIVPRLDDITLEVVTYFLPSIGTGCTKKFIVIHYLLKKGVRKLILTYLHGIIKKGDSLAFSSSFRSFSVVVYRENGPEIK